MIYAQKPTRTHSFNRRGVIQAFGQWAVTAYGVENVSGPCSYEIDRSVLGHPWWSDHMADKSWVIRADFDAALDFARQHERTEQQTRIRDAVRDFYRHGLPKLRSQQPQSQDWEPTLFDMGRTRHEYRQIELEEI